MSDKNSGVFVNLVKKAVGLPTGNSSCCSPVIPAPEANQQPKTESSSCCGGNPKPAENKTTGGCC